MSGHGETPGRFEPCRRLEVGYHNTLLVHPGTKTAACLLGESYTEVRIFIPEQLSSRARHVNACVCVCVYGPN